MHRKCYFVPTATRRSVGTITVPSLCSNRRITVSISFHTASRSASLIRSRNGRISGSEFRLCSMAAATEAKRWELGTISTATSRKPERSKALRSTAGSPSANMPHKLYAQIDHTITLEVEYETIEVARDALEKEGIVIDQLLQ